MATAIMSQVENSMPIKRILAMPHTHPHSHAQAKHHHASAIEQLKNIDEVASHALEHLHAGTPHDVEVAKHLIKSLVAAAAALEAHHDHL